MAFFVVVDDVLVVVATYITEVVGLSKPLASMVRGTWCKQPPSVMAFFAAAGGLSWGECYER